MMLKAFQSVKKILFTLLFISVSSITLIAQEGGNSALSQDLISQSLKKSQAIELINKNQKLLQITYPKCYQYIQTILHMYPEKVSEFLFVQSSESVLQSHKSILMVPYAWLSGLEQEDPTIDEIIRNYITTQMQPSTSWINRIDWEKVSIGLIVGCLGIIAVHLYKIEKTMSRIDNQIKSNTLFWLCTLPNKMLKKFKEL